MRASPRGGWRELALVTLGFGGLTVALTSPLAFGLGNLGRTDNADGQFAIWNVAWVARTLVVDPLHVFDANIFYPHRLTLAYSEANLGAGLIAAPFYWLSGNPYTAHNVALLVSFVMSGLGMHYLVRHLTHDRRAAAVAGVAFAFTPYLFGHIPHIQLLMTAGLPLCMLAFHRLVERPQAGRAATLGLTMTLQTFFCAYYGVFAMLMIGYAVLYTAVSRAASLALSPVEGRALSPVEGRAPSDLEVPILWSQRRYWQAIGIAAAVAVIGTLPLMIPYVLLQAETGFTRPVAAAAEYSANWRMYLASNSYVHAPLMRFVGRSGELLFPGVIACVFAIAGTYAGWTGKGRSREIAVLYASIAVLAFWISLGPAAGLYRALYSVVPGFTFLRAPSRFGLLVAFAVTVLAGIGIGRLLSRRSNAGAISAALMAFVVLELLVPLRLTPAAPLQPVYQTLAGLPRGAVLELPISSHPFRFLRARYMLASTAHWMPIVVAYSDHIPAAFMDSMNVLADFPSEQAFTLLERDRVRYVVFHLDQYNAPGARQALDGRLTQFASYLRRLHSDDGALLFEIVSFPRP